MRSACQLSRDPGFACLVYDSFELAPMSVAKPNAIVFVVGVAFGVFPLAG